MGFLLQLRLLLWKNCTLKKRKPMVLVFELLIPLVLFFILIGIRKRHLAHSIAQRNFAVWPLPSSGVIPVMQSFCDGGGVKDEYGFINYPDSTIGEFLDELNSIGKRNSFFRPDFTPSQLGEIPAIYRSIVQDPIAVKDKFNRAAGFHLGDVLLNRTAASSFLVHNLSLPADGVESLFGSSVDMKEVYRLLLSPRPRRSRRWDRPAEEEEDDDDLPSMAALSAFLVSADNRPVLELLRFVLTSPDMSDTQIDPEKAAKAIKAVLFAPKTIRKAACSKESLPDIVFGESESSRESLRRLQRRSCLMSDADLSFGSHVIADLVDDNQIIKILGLRHWNVSVARQRIKKLVTDIERFNSFERSLRLFAALSKSLPQDACHTDVGNGTDAAGVGGENATSTEENVKKHDPSQPPGYGLVKVWLAMQETVCGRQPVPKPVTTQKSAEPEDLEDLGLTTKQVNKIGILVQMLYHNPRILYAPNDTDADKIIQKANETFVLLDAVTQYAHRILNVTAEIQEFLNQSSTAADLLQLRRLQRDLQAEPLLLDLIDSPALRTFVLNSYVANETVFLEQLVNISNAACSWITLMSGFTLNVFRGFTSEADALSYFMEEAYTDNVTVLATVVFGMNENGSLPNHMVYKIRQNASFTATTARVRKKFWLPGPRNWDYNYYQYGYIWIQDILERAMVNLYSERDVTEPGLYVHEFPYPCFMEDQFLFEIEHVMPLCLTISWVYSVSMLVQAIVYEKEQRLKEVMKMMGLTNGVHWVAWFITSFAQMTITVATLTLILKYGKVLTYSDPWVVFVVFETFAMANVAFSFLVSAMYSKAKIAAACAGIIYFLTYVPYMYIAVREETANDVIPAYIKSLTSLLSTSAFGLGAKYFAFYEEVGVGVQWGNIGTSPVEDDTFNLTAVTYMMVLDSIIYCLLAWYIEAVHPGSYGLPKPWYFLFTRSYWLGTQKTEDDALFCSSFFKKLMKTKQEEEDAQACAMSCDRDETMFEADPVQLPVGVCIENLTKQYSDATKPAVRGLTLRLFESQIASLLGHNGAGKTTAMSILTGLFPPTAGFATIYGQDIRSSMDLIRKSLGMCPQHNVLFDELTVQEHLWLYGRLKGTSTDDINKEMDKIIDDVGLPEKREQKIDCLSGGMKRKLSVAIAFVGGSRTVILDEPTAGVDPYSRRAIWDLILKYKQGRTILLSTHHMDEADILGDRIAILANGQLKCCGSPLFLKTNLGEGYHLYMVKQPTDGDHGVSFLSLCEEHKVSSFIRRHVPSAYLASETKHELHYVLPGAELRKGSYQTLFQALENSASLQELHLKSYGVKNTTLEEVFLKVADTARQTEEREESSTPSPVWSTLHKDSLLAKQLLPFLRGRDERTVAEDGLAPDEKPLVSPAEVGEPEDLRESEERSIYRLAERLQEADGDLLDDQNVESFVLRPQNTSEKKAGPIEGASSCVVDGRRLLLQQFWAIQVKRFHCMRRNWKGLFTQILLPAFFVSVAMSVALAAPSINDLPALVLSPSQYYNYTQPAGDVIGYANNKLDLLEPRYFSDADSLALTQTLRLASGVGATCVLKDPYNSSFDIDTMNLTDPSLQVVSEYYDAMCQSVFVPGLPLENFVPPVPTARPTTFPPWEGTGGTEASRNFTWKMTTSTPLPDTSPRYYPKCHCAEDKTGFVCHSYGYEQPPKLKVVTGDLLLDVTGQNESEYYLYTTDMYRLRRYGGLSFGLIRDFVPLDFGYSAEPLFRRIAVRHVAKAWFNHKGFHSMPTYVNSLNNAILRANLPKHKGNPAAYGISLINHPMKHTRTNFHELEEQIVQGTDILISIFIIVAMSFVPASFVLYLVYERYTKSKHLQLLSGVHPVVYWTANYFWDVCNYTVPATCCVLILLLFDIPAYTSHTNFPAVVSLFLMYGWSITPMMYPVSFIFREPSFAYIFLIVINLFIGITCVVTSFLLQTFSFDKYLGQVHSVLKTFFLMFPNYCLGRGLMDIAFNDYHNVFLYKTGQADKVKSPFDYHLVTRNLLSMALSGISFFVLTLLLEYRFFWKHRSRLVSTAPIDEEDSDVRAERERVRRGLASNDVLCLDNITKIYVTRKLGKHLAVDRLCVGVPEGECFGLLGVNGAGKSTTFQMLTGDTRATAGDAWLLGYSVCTQLNDVQRRIGYCPQSDALYDEMTAREHLTLYARFRGIPRAEESAIVNWALHKLDLVKYADTPAGTYSGGNKRKLATAIALMGGPSVIFLDEPTTGMDPYSRRFLWDLISSLVKSGRSVVLTSHSMEECEALCTRLAIMVNGHFKCLGSTQHLKNRFGEGYSVVIRSSTHDLRPVERYVQKIFPHAALKERHHNMLQYELRPEDATLSYVFRVMEEACVDLPIEDYSVSQNTLDNVFVNFVKQQSETHDRALSGRPGAASLWRGARRLLRYPVSRFGTYGVTSSSADLTENVDC